VHVELMAQQVPCCRNTVAKLMQKAGILPKAIRRFRVTTDSRKTKASPNLINRDFTSELTLPRFHVQQTYAALRLCSNAVGDR
jgi:transposase InsO family protein